MLEQPVAFAITIFSPNIWVASFIYGVSPQPAQAPLNSKYGFSNCIPFVVNLLNGDFTLSNVWLYS